MFNEVWRGPFVVWVPTTESVESFETAAEAHECAKQYNRDGDWGPRFVLQTVAVYEDAPPADL
jgi:hypothetical protein